MSFSIRGLSPEPFRSLWGMSDDGLAERGARRFRASDAAAYPDRIGLRYMRDGEFALLVNYAHQPNAGPYRSSHAVFVAERAEESFEGEDVVPEIMRTRLLSLRGFDTEHMLAAAELVEGQDVAGSIDRLFGDASVAYIHAHYARFGCFAARIDRA